MLKRIVFAVALTLAPFSAYAFESKGKYWSHTRHSQLHAQRVGQRMIAEAGRFLGLRHSPTGFRGPWCGDFLGFVARRVGAPRPHNYRLARSWAHDGRRLRAPVLGAVAVAPHHVGIVVRVLPHHRVLIRSGNHNHRVADAIYAARHFFAYVAI